MKKYIIVLFSLLALSTSCTDYLDKQPDDMKTDEMVWSSRMETEKYLANTEESPQGICINMNLGLEQPMNVI